MKVWKFVTLPDDTEIHLNTSVLVVSRKAKETTELIPMVTGAELSSVEYYIKLTNKKQTTTTKVRIVLLDEVK